MHWEDGEGTCVRSKPGQVRRPPSPRRLRVLEAHYVQPRRRPLQESRALTPSSPRRADRLHRLLRPVPLALALAARLGRQLARRVPAFALPVAARRKGGRARAADVRRGERDGARGLGRGRAAQVPDGCVPSSFLRSVQLRSDALSCTLAVWINPITGEKALQGAPHLDRLPCLVRRQALTAPFTLAVHAIIAWKLHYRTSPTDDYKLIDDLAEVRELLDGLQRPFLKPENVFFAPTEEGGTSSSRSLHCTLRASTDCMHAARRSALLPQPVRRLEKADARISFFSSSHPSPS